jgi:hypothetical protein
LKLIYQDQFNAPSGFPTQKTQFFTTGYADGRYFIKVSRGMSGWHNGKKQGDFVCRVVGRVTGSRAGGWGITLVNPDDQNRGPCFGITGNSTLEVMPSPFNPKPSGPQIAPFQVKSLKPGEEFNELLLVVKGRRVQVYANGLQACTPLVLDNELKSVYTVLMGFAGERETQAEYQSITVWSADGL